ncbi:hypothetical protein AAZX31_02G141100 [Glycine max]|uniref:Uncharacterized protein n=2 Tax=Glycine subgen. Soja TaxID=1462606 RepID=I1JFB0_SOYBN|nr:uncharacterized protein LOC100786285 [Glycine max]XP_028206616.1 uncharacterized protein LOC114390129 [Glycine soja]KAG5080101.1 hypothetical protein JHK86_004166 [Glycine max]KAH1060385.1 hypothetical protein GYH30_004050 [Glycine max]KAH1261512.1 hypothetical protein GmHk_02G004359 [Glycine max]KHN18885.1 hypothetical protein glysoja_028254 [Glycine soja]KRH71431.1 hypothetical protein GLYMA_02G147700v4 [Glycine max]|eukprot:XP_003520209.1 uncharacterized protein LOC100786285 [Glycine max]
MAAIHDDGQVGFEEGMLWLPSHVLDEACDTKVCLRNRHQKLQNHQQMHQKRHHKSPGEPKSQYSKSAYQRPKLATNGGPGMRAIFLGSGHRSCGTGVFLPQRAGTNFQPSKRPACAPILLPARVVQALNLNVQALGVLISPPQVQRYNPRCREAYNNNSTEKKSDQKDASKQCRFISQNECSSPEIFLPKEWTY